MQTLANPQTIYVATPECIQELCEELGEVSAIHGNLVFSSQPRRDVCFALDVWLNPVVVSFQSISEAARQLRAAGKFWFLNPLENVRRSHLIQAELRKLPVLTHTFPIATPLPPIGCFSLLDKNTMVYSTERWKHPPLGNFEFIEDKINPPNRAYLKLWEALSLSDRYPQAGETAVDLGASPGGWSYVMHTFGTYVTAVDKATLDPAIATLPRMTFLQQSAFALEPTAFKTSIDWLLCDVACYPERLYPLVQKWIASGQTKRMIFTIKLQGKTNVAMIQQFQALPHAHVIHLFYNKHEVTFFYTRPDDKLL